MKKAEDEAATAKREAAAELTRRQQEEQARQAAEREKKRLAGEAEQAEQRANAAEAAIVHVGLTASSVVHTLAATPSYRAAANLTTPDIEGTGAGSSGKWFRTNGSSKSMGSTQRVVLYSDVEAPNPIPFKDSKFDPSDGVVSAQGKVLPAGYDLGTELRTDVASGSFDRTSGPPKSFDVRDRWSDVAAREKAVAAAKKICPDSATCTEEETTAATEKVMKAEAEREATLAARGQALADAEDPSTPKTVRHPYRWTAEAGGTLGGARGTFRCGGSSSDATISCTVQNTGGGFVFTGPWRFVPSSGTVIVSVPDAEHMWFGWWSTETATTFTFNTDHGGTDALTGLGGVTGTATYNGIAVGQYAISGTLVADQGHGEFTAAARLVADFGSSTVIGSITNFSGQPDWEVSLTEGTINGAAVTGSSSSWTIGDDTQDLSNGNPWRAAFYSNLPAADRASVQPYGIAGTFEASHGTAARMAGAFGAHRR